MTGVMPLAAEGGHIVLKQNYTNPADEAVGMPLGAEGGHVVLHDGAVAAAALWSKHVEVVVAAVRLAVALVEALLAELLAALSAEEVLGVPGLLQSCHTFLQQVDNVRLQVTFRTIDI